MCPNTSLSKFLTNKIKGRKQRGEFLPLRSKPPSDEEQSVRLKQEAKRERERECGGEGEREGGRGVDTQTATEGESTGERKSWRKPWRRGEKVVVESD